jgi:hypothetical protein
MPSLEVADVVVGRRRCERGAGGRDVARSALSTAGPAELGQALRVASHRPWSGEALVPQSVTIPPSGVLVETTCSARDPLGDWGTIAREDAADGSAPVPHVAATLVQQQIAAGEQLLAYAGDQTAFAHLPTRERLAMLARAGLHRLDQERDLNRLLVRDLARFPDLLAQMRDDEIQRIYHVVSQWLATQAGPEAPRRDWPALAAVLVGAVSHYWLLCDVFGQHPAGIDQDRYLAAIVELAAGLLDADTGGAQTVSKQPP